MGFDTSPPSPMQERARRNSLAVFELASDNEPVKFVNGAGLMHLRRTGWKAGGYFTLAKWLYGASPSELEERLGLRGGEFGHVAYALVFERLPRLHEFDYRLTAAYPRGEYRSRADDARMAAKSVADGRVSEHSPTTAGHYYPRGDGIIHQWQLRFPIVLAPYVRTVTASSPFARRDNSTHSNEPKLGKLKGVDWL
jgi:hypothetical protein